MRKKMIIVFALIALMAITGILVFTQRQKTPFNGERVSNPGHFALRFERLHGTESENMVLQAGDAMHVSWQIESRDVNIIIGMAGEETLYRANDCSSGDQADFYVEIPQTGSYMITVSARKAKGQVEFLKVEKEYEILSQLRNEEFEGYPDINI